MLPNVIQVKNLMCLNSGHSERVKENARIGLAKPHVAGNYAPCNVAKKVVLFTSCCVMKVICIGYDVNAMTGTYFFDPSRHAEVFREYVIPNSAELSVRHLHAKYTAGFLMKISRGDFAQFEVFDKRRVKHLEEDCLGRLCANGQKARYASEEIEEKQYIADVAKQHFFHRTRYCTESRIVNQSQPDLGRSWVNFHITNLLDALPRSKNH